MYGVAERVHVPGNLGVTLTILVQMARMTRFGTGSDLQQTCLLRSTL